MTQTLSIYRSLGVLFLIICMHCSCHRYYKVSTTKGGNKSADTIQTLDKQSRYFILRTPAKAYRMKNITLNDQRTAITFTPDTLFAEHTRLLNPERTHTRYKLKHAALLSEVHVYTAKDTFSKLRSYTMPLNAISKIDIIEKDRGKTTSSYILGGLAYTVGALAVAAVIIAATKSSCPFISAYDGNGFVLQGETFGGAIYPQLVRHDYLPLKMAKAQNGNLQLKISNELQEKQFTDIAELIAVKHLKSQLVIPDQDGNLYTVSKPVAPYRAILANGKDVTTSITQKDDRIMYFDDSTQGHSVNKLHLQFTRTEQNSTAKLILRLKNSYWLDFLYGEVAKGLGSYYGKYTSLQMKKPAAELNRWTREQNIPLEVSIKINNSWKKVADVTTVGPLALRDIIVPLDLAELQNNDIEIRLASGYLFWEVDYVAMDFSIDAKADFRLLKPIKAHDETGKDVLNLLTKEDQKYLEQPLPGTVTSLEYKWEPEAGSEYEYSFILHTKGYYMHVRDFKGKPDKRFLSRFKHAGAFAAFSVERYKQFDKNELQYWVKNN
jgi:hypothetical protein